MGVCGVCVCARRGVVCHGCGLGVGVELRPWALHLRANEALGVKCRLPGLVDPVATIVRCDVAWCGVCA